jgi:Arc/MetJ family transcription regulator
MALPTNLQIDDDLLSEAKRLGKHRTKRETVNEALREYIQRRKRLAVLKLIGKIKFDPRYDYKRARATR